MRTLLALCLLVPACAATAAPEIGPDPDTIATVEQELPPGPAPTGTSNTPAPAPTQTSGAPGATCTRGSGSAATWFGPAAFSAGAVHIPVNATAPKGDHVPNGFRVDLWNADTDPGTVNLVPSGAEFMGAFTAATPATYQLTVDDCGHAVRVQWDGAKYAVICQPCGE